VDQINRGRHRGKLVKDDTLYREQRQSMKNLKEIPATKVNRGDGRSAKLVNDQEFYKNAKLSCKNWTRPRKASRTPPAEPVRPVDTTLF